MYRGHRSGPLTCAVCGDFLVSLILRWLSIHTYVRGIYKLSWVCRIIWESSHHTWCIRLHVRVQNKCIPKVWLTGLDIIGRAKQAYLVVSTREFLKCERLCLALLLHILFLMFYVILNMRKTRAKYWTARACSQAMHCIPLVVYNSKIWHRISCLGLRCSAIICLYSGLKSAVHTNINLLCVCLGNCFLLNFLRVQCLRLQRLPSSGPLYIQGPLYVYSH
jgi:hypothetical protein